LVRTMSRSLMGSNRWAMVRFVVKEGDEVYHQADGPSVPDSCRNMHERL
jgi:hypothetical protein